MTDEKIGLIAGSGSFPLLFAAEAKKAGRRLFIVGLEGITQRELEPYAEETAYFRLGQVSGPIDFLKSRGVKKTLMAGYVPHVSIFGGLIPDLRGARLLLKLRDKKAGSIFEALAEELNRDGIELVNSSTLLEHLLVKPGLTAGSAPAARTLECAAFGWKAAKALAALDIGLTVVLRDHVVLAAEALEGTDACIKRAGEILSRLRLEGRKGPAMVVVKVARPAQDMRFDLPVAGADTLVLEAGKTLIMGMEEFLKAAAETGITVFGAENERSFA